MNVTSVFKSEVPMYLRSGEFYRSLSDDEDQDQQIAVPSNTLKADTTVNNNEDLHHLLTSLRFWGVRNIRDEVIKYCLSEPLGNSCCDVLIDFLQDFPYVSVLTTILPDTEEKKLLTAVKSGILEIVRNILVNMTVYVDCCCVAANAGNLEILQYLYEQGGVLDGAIMNAALEGGDQSLACVKYLHKLGMNWPYNALITALQASSKKCFHYALDNGCTWEGEGGSDCAAICEDQYVEALKYAIQHGYPINSSFAVVAADNGAIKCLQALHEVNCPWDEQAFEYAAYAGHLHCLRYLHDHGCPWDADACTMAAQAGQFACLQYLHENGCPWVDEICSEAAQSGSLDCLSYLREQGCMWDDLTCARAAQYGHLHCLKYLHEQGCAWNKDEVCMWAASAGHLPCLQYLHEHGCHLSRSAMILAVQGNRMDCVRYMLQQGCPIHVNSCDDAAFRGNLPMLQLLHEAGAPWDENTCNLAALEGHINCLQYAHEHGCPWGKVTFPAEVEVEGGQLECLKYLQENGCEVDRQSVS